MGLDYLNNLTVKQPKNDVETFQVLPPSFYGNVRNEITESRLNALAKIADNIEEPNLYGLFNDSSHYLNVLKLTLNSTAETRHRGIFFIKKVLPLLDAKDNLLDLGIGDGKLTRWISKSFKEISVVDINKEAIERVNMRSFRKGIKLNKIHGSVLNVQLPEDHINLCVLSHVLYYLNEEAWLDVIKRQYKSMKSKGIMVIVLSGDMHDKAHLIKYFGGVPPKINFLYENCIRQFGKNNVKGYASNEVLIAKSLRSMMHICGFMLYDSNVIARKEELSIYADSFLQRENGDFVMSTQQKFILITKP